MNIGKDCSNIIKSYIEDLHREDHKKKFKLTLILLKCSESKFIYNSSRSFVITKSFYLNNYPVFLKRYDNILNTYITTKCRNTNICEMCSGVKTIKLKYIIEYLNEEYMRRYMINQYNEIDNYSDGDSESSNTSYSDSDSDSEEEYLRESDSDSDYDY